MGKAATDVHAGRCGSTEQGQGRAGYQKRLLERCNPSAKQDPGTETMGQGLHFQSIFYLEAVQALTSSGTSLSWDLLS